jgi:hypothetical protein
VKKIAILFCGILLFTTLSMAAENDGVLGDWDCEAVVDMTYPFTMNLSESDNELAGRMGSEAGELDLASVSYEEEKLKFQIDYPGVGTIDWEGKLVDAKLTGTLGNDMFVGDFTCKRQE